MGTPRQLTTCEPSLRALALHSSTKTQARVERDKQTANVEFGDDECDSCVDDRHGISSSIAQQCQSAVSTSVSGIANMDETRVTKRVVPPSMQIHTQVTLISTY